MTPTTEQVAAWLAESGVQIYLHQSESCHGYFVPPDALQRFAALACAWQAEQDAKLCEQQETEYWSSHEDENWTPVDCADAIRASVKGGA